MVIDEYGVLHFWDGGESDAGPGEGGDSSADGVGIGSDGIDAGATDASLGQAGVENAMDALGAQAMGAPEAEVSPGGMTFGELSTLSEMGFGQMTGVNPNNPTQSVDEALAAANVHAGLNFAVPALVGMVAPPGFNALVGLGKGLAGLTSGQISPAQFGGQLGIAALSLATGIPTAVLGPALSGNLDQAGVNAGLSLGQMALSQATGLHPGLVGLGMQAALGGQSGAIGQGAASVGSPATGGVGGIDFSGVGGAEAYDPTQELAKSSAAPVSYGYVPYELADVRAGQAKTPYGATPYGAYYG